MKNLNAGMRSMTKDEIIRAILDWENEMIKVACIDNDEDERGAVSSQAIHYAVNSLYERLNKDRSNMFLYE